MANSAVENKSLTAIRGFAALWVVVFHLNMSWSFPLGPHAHAALVMGYVAVDVFFVLSGFILTLVYPALIGRDGSGSFALRRICRIYPLHLCIMTALGLAGLYTEMRYGESHPWNSFWPAVVLVQPYLGIESMWNVPSWSLGVELLCYALFPFANGAMRSIRRFGLIGIMLMLAVIELTVLQHYADVAAGPGAVLRALAGFFLGCALAKLFLAERGLFARHSAALQVVALAALIVAMLVDNGVGVVLAAAALITALASSQGPVVRLLSARVCVWLGEVSFSIYLLHIPLLSSFEKLGAVRAALAIPSLRFAVAGLFLAVLLALSGMTYRLIERPFRRLPGWLLIRHPTPSLSGALSKV
jgi:peptidoglycan/LPS O-acetylase OafA/YrhL